MKKLVFLFVAFVAVSFLKKLLLLVIQFALIQQHVTQ